MWIYSCRMFTFDANESKAEPVDSYLLLSVFMKKTFMKKEARRVGRL